MTGGDALARQLVREGVRHVFGVPGVQLDWALDGLAKVREEITFFSTRHEQAAAYMADGYARSTGDVGVCMVVPGPGALNATAALATAFACSSRVLFIAGQVASDVLGRGLGVLHEIPGQSETLASLSKWHAVAGSTQEIPDLVRESFRQLRSGRPRPVVLEIPHDLLQQTTDVRLVEATPEWRPVEPDPEAVAAAADRISRAQQPVIYAGGGVVAADASPELERLAEAVEAPVVMSVNGRGAISSAHRLAVSSLGGRRLLPDADLVLVVGSRFVDNHGHVVGTAPESDLILVNAEEGDLGPPREPDVALHADAKLGLAALASALESTPRGHRRDEELVEIRAWCAEQIEAIQPQWDWVRALRAAIPRDGLLVNELTQVGFLAQVAYDVYEPRTYLSPGYQGTLGYGFPTALGAAIADPDRPVISITGDGGFGWSLQELATARKYDIDLVVVVFNDGAFGNVRRTQKVRFEGRVIGSDLVNPDLIALAEAFGVPAVRITEPAELESRIKEGLATSGPFLIEAQVGEMPSAWHLLLDFLAQR